MDSFNKFISKAVLLKYLWAKFHINMHFEMFCQYFESSLLVDRKNIVDIIDLDLLKIHVPRNLSVGDFYCIFMCDF